MAIKPGDPSSALTKQGEVVTQSIVRSHVLASVLMWMDKWPKRKVIDLTAKTFVVKEMYVALCLLAEATGALPPSKRFNSGGRSSDEAYAIDLHHVLEELDRTGKLPDIVVPYAQLVKCPVDTAIEGDPTIVTRMERLEKAVLKVLENSPPEAPGSGCGRRAMGGGSVSKIGGNSGGSAVNSFGPALQRARSISREREMSGEQTLQVSGEQVVQQTWADKAAGGVKRLRPGATDEDGFRVPGRPPRKVVPKGTSTVDLSELGGAVVAPIERYIGNTEQRVTPDIVVKAMKLCGVGLPGADKLEVLKVEQINSHLQHVRTRAWKVTVPYSCREIMDNAALYPPGWTHRAYFAPRQDRSKRPRAGQQQGLSVVDTIIQSEERAAEAKQQEQEDMILKETTTGVEAELARARQTVLQA